MKKGIKNLIRKIGAEFVLDQTATMEKFFSLSAFLLFHDERSAIAKRNFAETENCCQIFHAWLFPGVPFA